MEILNKFKVLSIMLFGAGITFNSLMLLIIKFPRYFSEDLSMGIQILIVWIFISLLFIKLGEKE